MTIQVGQIFKNHITNCVKNDKYAAKALLLSTIALDTYSHVVDYKQLGKAKEIKKDKKEYLKAYTLAEGAVSPLLQIGVGMSVISDKAQNFMAKKLSSLSPKLEETLKNSAAKKNLMVLSSLLAAVVLTKRVLSPFLATPLAAVNNKNSEHNKVAKHGEIEENIFQTGKHKVKYGHDND